MQSSRRHKIQWTGVLPFAAILLALSWSGCLTVETKEYYIKLKTDQSGEATIRFVNIKSETDDSINVSTEDFQTLIDSYYKGNKIEKENPGYRNVQKKLYEQSGVLVGEISFTFDSLSVVRLFKYDKESPYMYFAGNPISAEELIETNGTYGGSWMPVVFWRKDSREFTIKTRISSEAVYRRSLLKAFHQWKSDTEGRKNQ